MRKITTVRPRRRMLGMLLAAATALGWLAVASPAQSALADEATAKQTAAAAEASKQIVNGDIWYDTDGNQIQAYGGSVNVYNEKEVDTDINQDGDKEDDVYLLFGTDYTHGTRPVDGFNGYWSEDLVTWHNMGKMISTTRLLPYKTVTVQDGDDYVDENFKQAAVGSKFAVLDDAQYAKLKEYANYTADEAKEKGIDADLAESAKRLVKPYVTEWNSDGTAKSYDEEHLKMAFSYLNGDFDVTEVPMITYNAKTGKWLIIFHTNSPLSSNQQLTNWLDQCRAAEQFSKDGTCDTAKVGNMPASRYGRAQVGFAEADSPYGPFKLINATRMNYDPDLDNVDGRIGESRGIGLYIDKGVDGNNDGVDDAYITYASENNAWMYISLLNDTYTDTATKLDAEKPGKTWQARILPDRGREASPIFKWNGWYYMLSKIPNGWGKAPVTYYRTKQLISQGTGTWENCGNPFVGDEIESAWHSEPVHILTKDQSKGQFVYIGDRWVTGANGSASSDSKLIFLPIELKDDGGISITGRTSWDPNDPTVYRAPKDYAMTLELGSHLPTTLTIDGSSTPVEWQDGADSQVLTAAAGDTLTLEFLANDVRYRASVQVIEPGLEYFIDSGVAEADAQKATEFQSVKAAVSGLKNELPDS